MAYYYVDLSKGTKGNSANRCDYITRTGKASGFKDLVVKGTVNLPPWAKSGRDFFDKADLFERKNGSTFKQIIVALPNELSLEENKKIVQDILDKVLGDTKAGVWAIHSVQAKFENTTNIHAHIMFSERIIDKSIPPKPPNIFFKRCSPDAPESERGYLKDDTYTRIGKNATLAIKQLRKDIEIIINDAYERAGLDIRISCETLQKQKEEAIKNKDYDKASMLNRKPIETIPLPKWMKIKSLAKQLDAFDYQNPIPLMPNKTNENFFNALLEEDIDAAEMLVKKLEGRKEKFKLETEYKISQGIKAIEKIQKQKKQKTKELQNVELKDFRDIILSIEGQLQSKIKNNENYLLLYQRIFKDQKSIARLISNVITRGRYKRFLKAKAKIISIEKDQEKLLSQNKLTSMIEEKNRLIIKATEELKTKLEKEITAINSQNDFNERYQKLSNRLEKYFPKALEKAKKAFSENENLRKIEEVNDSILYKINSNPELKITVEQIQKLQVDTRAELKMQLDNINNNLKEQIDANKSLQKIKEQRQKTKDQFEI